MSPYQRLFEGEGSSLIVFHKPLNFVSNEKLDDFIKKYKGKRGGRGMGNTVVHFKDKSTADKFSKNVEKELKGIVTGTRK